ncbi:MAG: hypothetical protein M0R33_15350 [Methylomonas sp.]|jgi:hypothetical protein|uniref:hypothetical protein n=1 Tax=Methylomonas sp. TaxID=418 RepID=UPI0025CFBBE6|nr:hypothetical protein [Methylomonas sp.]MCK9607818.1 hypothetical protein [Methylomonas sp.]
MSDEERDDIWHDRSRNRIDPLPVYARHQDLVRIFPMPENPLILKFVIEILTDAFDRVDSKIAKRITKARVLSLRDYLAVQNVLATVNCPLSIRQCKTLVLVALCVRGQRDRIEAAMCFFKFLSDYHFPKVDSDGITYLLFSGILKALLADNQRTIYAFHNTEDESFWRRYAEVMHSLIPQSADPFCAIKEAIRCAALKKGFVLPFNLCDTIYFLQLTNTQEFKNMLGNADFLPIIIDTLATGFWRPGSKLQPNECFTMLHLIFSCVCNLDGDISEFLEHRTAPPEGSSLRRAPPEGSSLRRAHYNRESISTLLVYMPETAYLFGEYHIPLTHNAWRIIVQNIQIRFPQETQTAIDWLIKNDVSPFEKDLYGQSALTLMQNIMPLMSAETSHIFWDKMYCQIYTFAAHHTLRAVYLSIFAQIVGDNSAADCPFALIASEEYARLISSILRGDS